MRTGVCVRGVMHDPMVGPGVCGGVEGKAGARMIPRRRGNVSF